MDFLHDQLYNGRKIRVLAVVDTFTRDCPALDVRPQFRGADVVETLEAAGRAVGFPKTIRVDNVLHRNGAAYHRQKVSGRHLAIAA